MFEDGCLGRVDGAFFEAVGVIVDNACAVVIVGGDGAGVERAGLHGGEPVGFYVGRADSSWWTGDISRAT
jgi:hypothetical protein